MHLALIAAMDKQQVIGYQNRLPWHVSADLKWFKAMTLGKPVLMGRKTFESIGKPLPGRQNIVISHDANYLADGVDVVTEINAAMFIVDSAIDEIMVIGGATIYQQTLPLAQRLYLTRLDIEVEGDTFFPEWSLNEWHLTNVEKFTDEKTGITGEFQIWERIISSEHP